jgi:hypothetical protein
MRQSRVMVRRQASPTYRSRKTPRQLTCGDHCAYSRALTLSLVPPCQSLRRFYAAFPNRPFTIFAIACWRNKFQQLAHGHAEHKA